MSEKTQKKTSEVTEKKKKATQPDQPIETAAIQKDAEKVQNDAKIQNDAEKQPDTEKDNQDAINALKELSPKLFARMSRRLPLRAFLAELERLDRAVFYRYFKGYRPQKIDANHLERVLKKEIFEVGNGLMAQLVIYNWDEAEYKLYGELQKGVKAINEDVEAIEAITDEQGDEILQPLEALFDKRDVCIATIINGVRVSTDYKKARFGEVN